MPSNLTPNAQILRKKSTDAESFFGEVFETDNSVPKKSEDSILSDLTLLISYFLKRS